MGIQTISEIPENASGIYIIRTHGATPQTIQKLESTGRRIVDATCPDVKRVQDKAKDLAKDGYRVIIIGRADHPEVVAIKAHADLYASDEALVISSKNEVDRFLPEIKAAGKVGIVIQTTQRIENLQEVLPFIAEHSAELKIYNTICSATLQRQESAKELAGESELMIVVGSRSSANTTHLAEILKPVKETIHIDKPEELENFKAIIEKAQNIGVTAGASTPDYVINEVIKKIS